MDYERRIEKLELKLAPKKRFATIFLRDKDQDMNEARRATGNDPDDPNINWFIIRFFRDDDADQSAAPIKDEEFAEELKARAELSRLEELRRHGLAE
jgi:hypothetical protein